MPAYSAFDDEWLETDGLGGFASGTVGGRRTRRYHALLLAASRPPSGRMVLVNGFDAWVCSADSVAPLSTQHYQPDVVTPEGFRRIADFHVDPWPTWIFEIEPGVRVQQELFVPHGTARVVLSWRLLQPAESLELIVRPFFSGRDYHSLHHKNSAFGFTPQRHGFELVWSPYPGVPGTAVHANGEYVQRPSWIEGFRYAAERDRGLDFVEDCAAPGDFRFELSETPALMILSAVQDEADVEAHTSVEERYAQMRERELERRSRFFTSLHRSAEAYFVGRGEGRTIVAGYPWFTDWGRDTFISMRGLCLALKRFEVAEQILGEWAETVSEGMLPNRFPDGDHPPEYNSVDSSLWFVIVVHEFLDGAAADAYRLAAPVRRRLLDAVHEILTGYSRGTRFGIHCDSDGLIAAGQPGTQLTWMDAKVGDWVVTPRIGKPVEIEALWLNALRMASRVQREWAGAWEHGSATFQQRYWNSSAGCLYDVIDASGVPGQVDASIRPNQLFAAGGLPICLLDAARAAQVVQLAEERLWTPLGLRTLDPADPNYRARCDGDVPSRDGAYHQGTVWPWLIGPFVEAWVKSHGRTPAAREQAFQRYLAPLESHLCAAGLGHISEIADGDPPHLPRGCPFQAWSLGEYLRLKYSVLGNPDDAPWR